MTSNEHAIDIGRELARRLFAKRGNHSEAHLSELDLAAICALAAERALAIPAVETSGDLEKQRMRTALNLLAKPSCERLTTGPGSCWSQPSWTPEARYTADKWCDACIALSALLPDAAAKRLPLKPSEPLDAPLWAGDGSGTPANDLTSKQMNPVAKNLEILRSLVDFAYEQGYPDLGYDIVTEIEAQIPPTEPTEPRG
jgi:hypothetical protein